MTAVNCFVA